VKTIDLADATGSLAEYAKSVHDTPVIVTRDGRPMAALVPIENADLESVALANNPKFLEIIDRSRTRYRKEGGISSDKIREEFHDQ